MREQIVQIHNRSDPQFGNLKASTSFFYIKKRNRTITTRREQIVYELIQIRTNQINNQASWKAMEED